MRELIDLSRENEALCLLARTRLSERARDRVQAPLPGSMDWNEVIRGAADQRVLGMVYRSLKACGWHGVPDGVLECLRESHLVGAARSLRLAALLKDLLRALGEKGIPAAPFKGPVLAQILYGDITMRRFMDLDILVPASKARAAVEVLRAKGYAPEVSFQASQFRAYALRNKSLSLIDHVSGVPVDLHWDLSGDYTGTAMTYEVFEDRFQPVNLLGTACSTLGNEDLLLYLCLHGTMESWTRLDQVCSVAELIQQRPQGLDQGIWKKAKRLRMRRVLLAGCALAEALVDCPVPEFLMDAIGEDRHVRRYTEACILRMFGRDSAANSEEKRPKFSKYHFMLRDGPLEGIRHALFLICSPTIEDWRRLPLPGSLGFLLCGYRPLRLGMDLMRRYRRRWGVRKALV